jgi:hypothetical protein
MTAEALLSHDVVAPADCRRSEPRRRVLLAGKIVQANGIALDCTIRNITEHGAQIRAAAGQIVPNTFDLIEIRTGIAYRAEVAWRTPAGMGLKFSGRFDLNSAGAPLPLRVLWLGCASRGVSASAGG